MKEGEASSAVQERGDGSLEQLASELANALAEVVHDSAMAILIAKRAGFARQHLPNFERSHTFWGVVIEQALDGRIERGAILALVARALEVYPHNPELLACRERLSVALAFGESARARSSSGSRGADPSARGRVVVAGAIMRRWLYAAGAVLGIATIASFMLAWRSEGVGSVETDTDASAFDEIDQPPVDLGGPAIGSSMRTDLTTGESPARHVPAPSSCLRDADCGKGYRCERPRAAQEYLGTITKERDRGSQTELVGHQCANGNTRVGRPQGKVGAANGVECRVEWRLADEHSCEVDVILLGPQTEEARCDVYATLRSTRGPRGRCKPS